MWVCKDGSGADCKIVTMDENFVSAADRFQVGVEPGPVEGGEAPDEGCRGESGAHRRTWTESPTTSRLR